MKRIKSWILGALLAVVVAGGALAGDFEKGMDAFLAGDYATTLAELTPLAKEGFAPAQYLLGAMYAEGRGVPQDDAEAVKWWHLAAEAGVAEAQNDLGVMYANGRGVEQDYAESAKWYRLAAEAGVVDAQYNLGQMYLKGEGVEQDYAEAVKWWRLAAEAGLADAQNNLGVMYAEGEGVLQDDRLAYMWFNLAAAQGNENSSKGRDIVANRMPPAQRAEAQAMSRRCFAQNYKGC